MDTTQLTLIIAATSLIAVAVVAAAGLSGFFAWLNLKRSELNAARDRDAPSPITAGRIEIADLKERLRKLEAIAAGVDL